MDISYNVGLVVGPALAITFNYLPNYTPFENFVTFNAFTYPPLLNALVCVIVFGLIFWLFANENNSTGAPQHQEVHKRDPQEWLILFFLILCQFFVFQGASVAISMTCIVTDLTYDFTMVSIAITWTAMGAILTIDCFLIR